MPRLPVIHPAYRLLAWAVLVLAALVFGYTKGVEQEGLRRDLAAAKADGAAWDSFTDLLRRNAATDSTHYKKLRRLEHENAVLRADVERGRVRLRVAAVCPSGQGEGAGTGLDHGGAPELDPAARPAYFALREGIILQQQQLKACQDRLK